MAAIRVNVDELSLYSKQMLAISDDMKDVLKLTDDVMKTLEAGWEGSAFQEFNTQYQAIATKFGNTIEYIISFSEAMDKTVEQFMAVDTEIGKSIKSVSV